MVSLKELYRQLNYNPLNGIFKWKISPANSVQIGDTAGTKKPDGYIVIKIKGIDYYAHILAWFYYYGYWPENDIDHRNQKKHCNWILNLREVSKQCDTRNKDNICTNTSGVKGVYKSKNKWKSQIGLNNKLKYLGTYKEFDNAVCARLAGEQCLNWTDCDSNSPAFKYVTNNIQKEKTNEPRRTEL